MTYKTKTTSFFQRWDSSDKIYIIAIFLIEKSAVKFLALQEDEKYL